MSDIYPEVRVSSNHFDMLSDWRRLTWTENHGNACGQSEPFDGPMAFGFEAVTTTDLAEVTDPQGRVMLFVERLPDGRLRCCG